ncbi:MAG TPA: hypothetical protein VLM42_07880 [Bryobacteraceae bacterium]|nr:hypothetical protein [Bryobacteraceae bacterium]
MITPGTILIQKGTLLPPAFRPGSESYPNDWVPVKISLDPHDLEKEFAILGWTFHYMAGKVKTTAYGFDRQKALDKALALLIAGATRQKCNCLEIDEVATRTFLGLPGVSVSAHTRHIQKGMTFRGVDTPNQPAPPDPTARPAVALP